MLSLLLCFGGCFASACPRAHVSVRGCAYERRIDCVRAWTLSSLSTSSPTRLGQKTQNPQNNAYHGSPPLPRRGNRPAPLPRQRERSAPARARVCIVFAFFVSFVVIFISKCKQKKSNYHWLTKTDSAKGSASTAASTGGSVGDACARVCVVLNFFFFVVFICFIIMREHVSRQ
jgi:hypothetical protein